MLVWVAACMGFVVVFLWILCGVGIIPLVGLFGMVVGLWVLRCRILPVG